MNPSIQPSINLSIYLSIYLSIISVDTRPLTCVLEERFYHKTVVRPLKILRREERSQVEADRFIAQQAYRTKKQTFQVMVKYLKRRNFIR